MYFLQILLFISCGYCAIAAQGSIIFPSGRSGVGRSVAGAAALPINVTTAISRGSEAFSLDLFQVWTHSIFFSSINNIHRFDYWFHAFFLICSNCVVQWNLINSILSFHHLPFGHCWYCWPKELPAQHSHNYQKCCVCLTIYRKFVRFTSTWIKYSWLIIQPYNY